MEIVLIIHIHTSRLFYPLLVCEKLTQELAILIQKKNRATVSITYQDMTEDISANIHWKKPRFLISVGKFVLS